MDSAGPESASDWARKSKMSDQELFGLRRRHLPVPPCLLPPRCLLLKVRSCSCSWAAGEWQVLTFVLTVITGAALVATSLGLGYAWGVKTASGSKSSTKRREESKTAEVATPKVLQDENSDSEMEEEDLADGDLSSVKPGFLEPCKMVRLPRVPLYKPSYTYARFWSCAPT